MKKFTLVIIKDHQEVDSIPVETLLNLPSYESKSLKELVDEFKLENKRIKLEFRDVI